LWNGQGCAGPWRLRGARGARPACAAGPSQGRRRVRPGRARGRGQASHGLNGANQMQIGVIGLGRMGGNIVRRLMAHGHDAVVYDRDSKAVAALSGDGAAGAAGIDELVRRLAKPRAVWVMLPAGEITEATIGQLADRLEPDDVIIDGGNTFWKDDVRRAR